MDGVIVDSNPFHKKALLQFCEKHGYHLTDEELQNNIYGRTNKDWLTNLFGKNISDEQIQQFEQEKETLFRQIYAPHIKPVAGLIYFLEELRTKNIARAVATSAPPENVEFTLQETNTAQYFDIILDGSSVENSKPHPEIYLKTAETLDYAPESCIVIEDSLSGVESARRAGSRVIAITTTHSRNEISDVDLIIGNFHDLSVNRLSQLFEK